MSLDANEGRGHGRATAGPRIRRAAALALALLAAPAGAGGVSDDHATARTIPSRPHHAVRQKQAQAKTQGHPGARRPAQSTRHAHPAPAPRVADDYLPPMG